MVTRRSPARPDEIRRFLRLCLQANLVASARQEMRGCVAEEGFDWTAVFPAAHNARVAPLLYRIWRDEPFIPSELLAQLRQEYLANGVRNAAILHGLAAAVEALGQSDVPVIVLKGAALAQPVYGNIALRPFVDVDVLMRREHLAAALETLAGLGFAPVQPETRAGSLAAFENEVLLVKPGAVPVPLEIHWSLFDSPFYQEHLDLEVLWRSAVPLTVSQATTSMLDPVSLLLHLCGHLALHHGGRDLLWEHDIDAVVHATPHLDWSLLLERAKRFHLVLSVQQILLGEADEEATSVPEPVADALRRLTASDEERRAVGHLTAPKRGVGRRFWSDLVDTGRWSTRLAYAWTHLCPSAEYMRARYRIRHPLLLPLYYPYRWLRGLLSWGLD